MGHVTFDSLLQQLSYIIMKVSFLIQDSSTLIELYFCVSKFLHLSEVAKFNSSWKFTPRSSIKIFHIEYQGAMKISEIFSC